MGPKLATKRKKLTDPLHSGRKNDSHLQKSKPQQISSSPIKKKPKISTKQHCLFCLTLLRRYFPPEIARYLVFLINITERAPSIHPIQVEFKTNYHFKFSIGGIVRPQGCIVGKNGNLIIMGSEPGAYSIYSPEGELVTLVPADTAYNAGVAVDKKFNMLFCDYSASEIVQVDSDGVLIQKFGGKGHSDGEMNSPYALAVDVDGHLLVAEYDNHRISVFDENGKFLSNFGSKGGGDDELSAPGGIAVDNDGFIVVSDQGNDRIVIYDSNYKYVRSFSGSGGHSIQNPSYICVDRNGSIAVCDTVNHRVSIFSQSGDLMTTFGSIGSGNGQLNLPRGIAVDADGNLIVTDWQNDRVCIFG